MVHDRSVEYLWLYPVTREPLIRGFLPEFDLKISSSLFLSILYLTRGLNISSLASSVWTLQLSCLQVKCTHIAIIICPINLIFSHHQQHQHNYPPENEGSSSLVAAIAVCYAPGPKSLISVPRILPAAWNFHLIIFPTILVIHPPIHSATYESIHQFI